MNKIKLKLNRGFTFIEVMIVVCIIGILLAIFIPQCSSYRERALERENAPYEETIMQEKGYPYGPTNME